MPLIFADRANVVEGIIDDFRQGHFPNLWEEFGLTAECKYNRKRFILKTAPAISIAAITLSVVRKYKKRIVFVTSYSKMFALLRN